MELLVLFLKQPYKWLLTSRFKKETLTFDYPRGSPSLNKLKQGGLFPGLSGSMVDASINPMDKTHMFKKNL